MRALTVLSVPVSVDFTDLLISTVELLEESESDELAGPLVRHARQNIQHVVVDGYQDTNHIQEPLIRALTRFGANLCVVVGGDQTIYQWRGSAVSSIRCSCTFQTSSSLS